MRRSKAFLLVITIIFLLFTNVFAGTVKITYETAELGAGRWEYTYDVMNISLTEEIKEFTMWFDYGFYDNLAVSTPATPTGWDQIVWQVEPVLEDPGGYDALATNLKIAMGTNLGGFSVTFDWLGIGEPGSQYYEIIDPVTFGTIESGYTVPEPTTCLLLLSGALLLRRRKI